MTKETSKKMTKWQKIGLSLICITAITGFMYPVFSQNDQSTQPQPEQDTRKPLERLDEQEKDRSLKKTIDPHSLIVSLAMTVPSRFFNKFSVIKITLKPLIERRFWMYWRKQMTVNRIKMLIISQTMTGHH